MTIDNKDNSIVNLIASIDMQQYGWTIRDYWDSDLCAIGVASLHNINKLVYICTFDKPDGFYDYDCDELSSDTLDELSSDTLDEYNYFTVKEGRDVNFHELIEAMQQHLMR